MRIMYFYKIMIIRYLYVLQIRFISKTLISIEEFHQKQIFQLWLLAQFFFPQKF